MATEIEICWPLKRYANCTREENMSNEGEKWTLVQAENGDLTLSLLKTDQVVVTKNNVVEQSFSLASNKEFFRGVSKGDSLLIICKYEASIRKFRVQFDDTDEKSALEGCKEFVKIFSIYFPISHSPSSYIKSSQREALSGEVAASSIVKIFLDRRICNFKHSCALLSVAAQRWAQLHLNFIFQAIQGEAEMPLPYSKVRPQLEPKDIKAFVYSCLFDATFPKFVDDVECILKSIIDDN